MELFKPEFGLVFWMFVTFMCLFGILAKWVWPFIIKSVEERADLIDKGVVYAQEAKLQLDNAQDEASKMLATTQAECADKLREAEKIRAEIIEKARSEASVEATKVKEEAQISIAQAIKESEKQIKQEAGELALQIAEKVLRTHMADDEAQLALVNQLLNEVETKN